MQKENGNVYGAKRAKQNTVEKGKGDREDYTIFTTGISDIL
jgi:hypothetical protein